MIATSMSHSAFHYKHSQMSTSVYGLNILFQSSQVSQTLAYYDDGTNNEQTKVVC